LSAVYSYLNELRSLKRKIFRNLLYYTTQKLLLLLLLLLIRVNGYDIYLSTAVGLTPIGSSTVHIYTQTIHRTTQMTIEQHK